MARRKLQNSATVSNQSDASLNHVETGICSGKNTMNSKQKLFIPNSIFTGEIFQNKTLKIDFTDEERDYILRLQLLAQHEGIDKKEIAQHIFDIREKAVTRSLDYYRDHQQDLAKDIITMRKKAECLDPIEAADLISLIAPFEAMLKALSPKLYKKTRMAMSKHVPVPVAGKIFSGNLSSAMSRVRTKGELDLLTGSIIVDNVRFTNASGNVKIGVGEAKIFFRALAEFTAMNNKNSHDCIKQRVYISVREYAAANGLDVTDPDKSTNNLKNFRHKIKGYLQNLRECGSDWEEKVNGKSAFFNGANLLGAYTIKGDSIMIEFSLTVAEALIQLTTILIIPPSFYQIDDRNANAFAIAQALILHYGQNGNVLQGTENKLSVESILKRTSYPTAEKIRTQKLSWRERVREQLEVTLGYLMEIGLLRGWEYRRRGGEKLSDREIRDEEMSYEEYVSLVLWYEISDYASHAERKALIAQKKRDARNASSESGKYPNARSIYPKATSTRRKCSAEADLREDETLQKYT
mgnify:CR=1 FL=1